MNNFSGAIDPEKLIESVRERRPIYDHNMIEYSNKPFVDALWADVAKELGSTTAECKVKWTCLRSSFARSRRELRRLSQCGQPNKRKKMWYLSDAMSFLSDFMYQYKKDGSNDDECLDNTDEFTMDNEENIQNADDSNFSGENDDLRSLQGKMLSTKIRRRNSSCFSLNGMSEPMVEIKESERQELSDPDLLFFRSLLPDLKSLRDQKKRKFKEMVLCSLNKFLDDEEKTPIKKASFQDYFTATIKTEPDEPLSD